MKRIVIVFRNMAQVDTSAGARTPVGALARAAENHAFSEDVRACEYVIKVLKMGAGLHDSTNITCIRASAEYKVIVFLINATIWELNVSIDKIQSKDEYAMRVLILMDQIDMAKSYLCRRAGVSVAHSDLYEHKILFEVNRRGRAHHINANIDVILAIYAKRGQRTTLERVSLLDGRD